MFSIKENIIVLENNSLRTRHLESLGKIRKGYSVHGRRQLGVTTISLRYYIKFISQNITKIIKEKLIQRYFFHVHACVWKRSTEVKRAIFQLRWTIRTILMQTARACMICGGNRKIRRFLSVSCQSCHLLRHQTYIQQVHLCKVTTQVSAVSDLLPPFQIIGRLTFLTSSLTTCLIQKICANIVKFKSLLKNLY